MTLLFSHWKLLAGGALLALVGGFYWSWSSRGDEIERLNDRNALLSSQLDTAEQVNSDLRATMEGERERYRRTLATLDAAERRARSRQSELSAIREATRDAEDGPLAPSLRSVLDGLRRRSGAAPDNEGRDDPPGDTAAAD